MRRLLLPWMVQEPVQGGGVCYRPLAGPVMTEICCGMSTDGDALSQHGRRAGSEGLGRLASQEHPVREEATADCVYKSLTVRVLWMAYDSNFDWPGEREIQRT